MSGSKRMTVIDALRGIACLIVIFPHMAGLIWNHESNTWMMHWVSWLPRYGHIGVDIFFVLSGFVIAFSLHAATIDVGFFVNFTLRRSVRLDPPYWAAIALMFGFLALRSVLTGRPAAYPGPQATIAHLFYVQDILGYKQINAVFWTLCLEIQFYLIFCLLLGGVRAASARRSWAEPFLYGFVFGSTWFLSLALRCGAIDIALPPGLFVPYWHEFLLGAFVWWIRAGILPATWLLVFVGTLGMTALAGRLEISTAMALSTAFLIHWYARREKLSTALSHSVLQYFGRISYSLYLVHVPAIFIVNGILRRSGIQDLPIAVLGIVAFAFLLSIGLAHVLHVTVERPSAELSRRLKRTSPRPAQMAAEAEGRREHGHVLLVVNRF